MMARRQPALEVEAGFRRGVGAGEAAGGETEALGFGTYCFLQALASIHGGQLHPCPPFL